MRGDISEQEAKTILFAEIDRLIGGQRIDEAAAATKGGEVTPIGIGRDTPHLGGITKVANGMGDPQAARQHPLHVLPSWCHAPARASSPYVRRLCTQLNPAAEPVPVPVRPELLYGDGPYRMGRCYDGVAEYQERVGGTFQHGWMLCEVEGIYLRAYHHCVHWDGGRLTDVSFQPHREILFLPTSDPGVPDEESVRWRCSEGREGVPGRYFPLSDSALARRIVRLHELKVRFESFSPEWFRLLDEIGALEFQFREWTMAKSAAARRRKAARRRSKGRKSPQPR